LHGLVDEHYLPHLFFNEVEILPGSSLLNGRLMFSENPGNLGYFAYQANEGYIRSVCRLNLPETGRITIRVGVDELAGGFFEFVVDPLLSEERNVFQGGMLMLPKSESRSLNDLEQFAVEDIFFVPQH
jgi:hypothetical protein